MTDVWWTKKIEGKSPEELLKVLQVERDYVISACEREVLAIDVKIDAVKAFIKPTSEVKR